MRFHFRNKHVTEDTCTMEVWFESSKEKVNLGTLSFMSDGGEIREDIMLLLETCLGNHLMFSV